MGVYIFNVVEKKFAVAPKRWFKASFIENYIVLPKVIPQLFKSIEVVEGDATSVGCVKKFNFAEEVPYKYFKTKNIELDAEKCHVKYITFEGDLYGDKVESVVYEGKLEENGVYKIVAHCQSKGDDIVLTDEDVKGFLRNLIISLDAVEEYLINNPDAYA